MGKVVDLEEELDTVKNARQELVLQVPHHTNTSSSSSSNRVPCPCGCVLYMFAQGRCVLYICVVKERGVAQVQELTDDNDELNMLVKKASGVGGSKGGEAHACLCTEAPASRTRARSTCQRAA